VKDELTLTMHGEKEFELIDEIEIPAEHDSEINRIRMNENFYLN
jgi:hypothetical protein